MVEEGKSSFVTNCMSTLTELRLRDVAPLVPDIFLNIDGSLLAFAAATDLLSSLGDIIILTALIGGTIPDHSLCY